MLRFFRLTLCCLAVACLSGARARAASEDKGQAELRAQYARGIEAYDFEPRGNSIESRDLDGDGRPDYWEPVRDDSHPEHLISGVRIVEVPNDERPGLWRNSPGHVLKIPFDGTRVAFRTAIPKTIDPDLAYEVSAYAKTKGINLPSERRGPVPEGGSPPSTFVRVKFVWLHGEDERQIGKPDVIEVPAGQTDWPISVDRGTPLNLLINDLPVDSRTGLRPDRVRVILEVEDNPDVSGADRHGVVWFDDIRIKSRPKIRVDPVFRDVETLEEGQRPPPLRLEIKYLGLIANVPEGAGFRGAQYSRSVRITDINGEPPLDHSGRPVSFPDAVIDPGPRRYYDEQLALPLVNQGVYYLTVSLRGYLGAAEAEVSQVVGLTLPPRAADTDLRRPGADVGGFGLRLEGLPYKLLQSKEGMLAEMVRRAGVQRVKVGVWPEDFKPQEQAQPYLEDLGRELRLMRSGGAHLSGIIAADPQFFGQNGAYAAMREQADTLDRLLDAIMPYLRAHIEDWQWGDDDDSSFSAGVDPEAMRVPRRALADKTAALVQCCPVNISRRDAVLPPAAAAEAVSLYVPADLPPWRMLKALSVFATSNFADLKSPRRVVYPSERLQELLPASYEDATAAETGHKVWLSLELRSVPRHERNAAAERAQVEDLAVKAILARAAGVERVCLGRLFHTESGLCAVDGSGRLVPRPALLAARTLEEHLAGAAYLGSFQLRDIFPNFVFHHPDPDRDEAVIALWYDGPQEAEYLDRLQLGDMPLTVVDMAGNARALDPRDTRLLVRKSPLLVAGMSASLALTRMSLRISPVPRLTAMNEIQTQELSITNYFTSQLPVQFEISYATDADFVLERGWTKPGRKKLDLRRGVKGAWPSDSLTYQVQPDPGSIIGVVPRPLDDRPEIWPPRPESGAPAPGEKYVQVLADINTSPAVRFKMLRKTILASDLDVRLVRLKKQDTANLALQFQLKWLPPGGGDVRGELVLRPYYVKSGGFPKERPAVSVPAYSPGSDRAAVTVELSIPVRPVAKTLVGLTEIGGSRFFILDVTEVLKAATE